MDELRQLLGTRKNKGTYKFQPSKFWSQKGLVGGDKVKTRLQFFQYTFWRLSINSICFRILYSKN